MVGQRKKTVFYSRKTKSSNKIILKLVIQTIQTTNSDPT